MCKFGWLVTKQVYSTLNGYIRHDSWRLKREMGDTISIQLNMWIKFM